MSDYTPSIDTARECFVDGAAGEFIAEDFDRMIESVRAEERERIAHNIAAKTPDGRKSAAFCAGMDRAARIASEGA